MKCTTTLVLINLILILSIEVIGAPVSYIPISKLEKSAVAIVIGSGRPVSQGGINVLVEITVNRVLKGPFIPQNQVSATWAAPSEYNARINPSRSVSGMWFLKSKEQSSWEILPVATGDVIFNLTYIPISIGPMVPDFSYESTAPTIEKIIYELGAEIERSEGESRVLIDLFSDESITPADPTIMPRLRARFAKSPSSRVKVLGLLGLIKQGNGEALAQLVNDRNMLDTAAREPALSNAICNCRGENPLLIETLGKLIAPENSMYLRRCAAYALRSIHTRDTLPYLAQLLDSDSGDLRYDGVIGLASFANNLPMQTRQNVVNMGWLRAESKGAYTTEETLQNLPSKPLFDKEEAKYVGFWKHWWATNRTTLIQ